MKVNNPNVTIKDVENKIKNIQHPHPTLCKVLRDYMEGDKVIDYSRNIDWYPILNRYSKIELIKLFNKL